jgi:hypothetical protein
LVYKQKISHTIIDKNSYLPWYKKSHCAYVVSAVTFFIP